MKYLKNRSLIFVLLIAFMISIFYASQTGENKSKSKSDIAAVKSEKRIRRNQFDSIIKDADGKRVNYSREQLDKQKRQWQLLQAQSNTPSKGPTRDNVKLSGDSEPFWSYAAFGSGIGATNMIIDTIGGQTEIYVGGTGGTFGADNYWYSLYWNSVESRYDQNFVSSFFESGIVSIHLADVINNSDKEIVVALKDGTIQLWDQATKEWLAEIDTERAGANDVEIADLNNDGKMDFVFCLTEHLYVYSIDGDLEWEIEDVGGYDCVIGQMDGDGGLEIALGDGTVVDALSHTIQWTYADGFGNILKAVDIDGDGRDELIATPGWYIIWAYDVETKTTKWSIPTDLDVDALTLTDIDSDSVIELLVGDGQWGDILCYDTATQALEWKIRNPEHGVTGIAVADVDGDSELELIWGAGYSSTGEDHIYFVNWQTEAFEWQNIHLDGPFLGPLSGDLDGDSIEELVTISFNSDAGYSSARILVFDTSHNLRGMSDPIVGNSAWAGARDLRLYDVDGDGELEILIATSYLHDGVIEIYDFHTNNTFTLNWTNTIQPDGSPFHSVGAGDIDGDGNLEIIGGGSRTHTGAEGTFVYVYDYNTSAEEWHSQQLGTYWGGISGLEIADVNNDGNLEIVAMAYDGEAVVFNGKTKNIDVTFAGPYRTLTLVNAHLALPLITLGNEDGEFEIYSHNFGTTYNKTYDYDFETGAIDGISPISAPNQMFFGSEGVFHIFNSSGLRWSSSSFGTFYGAGCTTLPGSDAIYSSGTYSINGFFYSLSETKSLSLISPNGNQTIQIGTVNEITWETTGAVGNVKIEFSTDNGRNWSTVIAATTNDGSYDWTVPSPESSECLIRISSGTLSDTSDSVFTTTNELVIDGLELTSPNGGENYVYGTEQNITWSTSGSVGNVKIQLSADNGSTWTVIEPNLPNTGKYEWTVPKNLSTMCLVKVTSLAIGSITDSSDAVFTIEAPQPQVVLTSPNGGEEWQGGSVHNITWTSYLTVGNVKLEYSTDNKATWTTITSSTGNDGSYAWTLPTTPSTTCFVRISEASDGIPTYSPNIPFSIIEANPEPIMSINRTKLSFGAQKSNPYKTPGQLIIVTNSGGGTLKWSCTKDNDDTWLRVSNTTGTQSGAVEISTYTFGVDPGTYTSDVVFTSSNAEDSSPQTVNVTLNVYAVGADKDPFGSFDTPIDGSTVMSSIAVTGWALDDLGIDKVKIYRDPITGEGTALVYVGEAVMVDGARTDVEQSYPGYPQNYQAGWGYMLLTNMLPGGGNGAFKLHAYAIDGSGHSVLLGSKSITCDNANAVKPFGAIDSPIQGGNLVGSDYRNIGWVLTPNPNSIATDGSTIEVIIDGVSVGNPVYNIYREDIATLFPRYRNSNGAMAYFDFDLSGLDSGLHTIQWTATDNAGNTDGIGSRYFSTIQAGYNDSAGTATKKTNRTATGIPGLSPKKVAKLPFTNTSSNPITFKTGYGNSTSTLKAFTNKNHRIRVTLPETQRMVMKLNHKPGNSYAAYLKVGQELRAMPVGSTLDYDTGTFSWQTGPAFLGKYHLVFVTRDKDGRHSRMDVEVNIIPEFNK